MKYRSAGLREASRRPRTGARASRSRSPSGLTDYPGMTISISSLLPTGTSSRTLSAATIKRCASVLHADELNSFWGRVKDYFLGTHNEDAKRAIFRLATAETARQQCSAFAQLAACIEPAQSHLLRWNLSADDALDFQIGDRRFPMKGDVTEFMQQAAPLSFDDSCRLLIALKLNDHDVLSESEQFGLPLNVLARHPDDPAYSSVCISAAMGVPALLDALHVLGLDSAVNDSQLALDVASTVQRMVLERRHDTYLANRCYLHAHQLMNIAAAIRDRD
ncbi:MULTISPECIES: hypothetical protein [Pandoraea]|uniref:hypothetical protein n=1 Tax=Pandoraea TaxID=93217 RepID=UPI001F5D162B|nr:MULTISPECIES: hypothetical protein [Pandoraea]